MHRISVGEFWGYSAMQVVSGPKGREEVHYEAPPGADVPKQVEQFLAWWSHSQGSMDGIISERDHQQILL